MSPTPFPTRHFKDLEMPEQEPTPPTFKATQHRNNWKIEMENNPAIFVQFPSLPVAIAEMKRKVKLTKILLEI